MPLIMCSRCKERKSGLDELPLPGDLGHKLMRQTCNDCWQAWVSQQLKIMNEYRLNPLNDEHNQFLDSEMMKFLLLE